MRTTANEIYHIVNRGVDGRNIYLDEEDYFRFIHDLFEFNDENPAFNIGRFFSSAHAKSQLIDVRRQSIKGGREPRKILVDILAFCLMPNHYHLLLQGKTNNSIPLFIKKLNGGYAKYFNLKYHRAGALFQGRYKAVLIKTEQHFLHIPHYIHFNPLDLVEPDWRKGKINNFKKAVKFLESYRWSSHLDYLGERNFPSVTKRNFLLEFFGGEKGYKKTMYDWLKALEVESIKHLTLE